MSGQHLRVFSISRIETPPQGHPARLLSLWSNASHRETEVCEGHPNVVLVLPHTGQCGSCWALTATAAVESAYFLKTRQSVDVSIQELVDCGWTEGNLGESLMWRWRHIGSLYMHIFEHCLVLCLRDVACQVATEESTWSILRLAW